MGILLDTIREVFDRGLRAGNAEINDDAMQRGLITPAQPEKADDAHIRCRAGFEGLRETLVGMDRAGGPQ